MKLYTKPDTNIPLVLIVGTVTSLQNWRLLVVTMRRMTVWVTIVVLLATPWTVMNKKVVHAHVLKQDNGVSVMLHIPPYDHPAAGVNTNLEVSLALANDPLDISGCSCSVLIQNNNMNIATIPIEASEMDANRGLASFVFPNSGVYTAIIEGSSLKDIHYRFRVSYQLIVAPSSAQTSQSTMTKKILPVSIIVIGIGSFAVFCVLVVVRIRTRGLFSKFRK